MLIYIKKNFIPTKPLLFLKTLNKTNAGGVSTILQENMRPQIYYALTDLLYNILLIDEQANKHIITQTDTIICRYACMCVCMYVYLCIYTCINSMLVCVHIRIYMPNIKTNNT